MVTITFPGTELLGAQVPIPILGTDPVPKAYVDGKVGQYAGGFLLFMNYSEDSIIANHRVLGQQVNNLPQSVEVTTEVTGPNRLVKQFVSEPLGVEVIPTGVVTAYIYGKCSVANSVNHYHFELSVRSENGTEVSLSSSSYSNIIDYDGSFAVPFTCSTRIGLEYASQLTDRLVLRLRVTNFSGPHADIYTYFEGNTYSYLQTSLNIGTTILSSNNTWTGENLFALPFTSNLNFESSGLTAELGGANLTMTGEYTDSQLTHDNLILTSQQFESTLSANTINLIKKEDSDISVYLSATLNESLIQVQDESLNVVQMLANNVLGPSLGITNGVTGKNIQITSSKILISSESGLQNEVLKSDGNGNVVWGTTFVDVYEGKCPVNDWLSVHLGNTTFPSAYNKIGYTFYSPFGWQLTTANGTYVMVQQISWYHGVWGVNFSASISNPDENVDVVVRSVEICVSVENSTTPNLNPTLTYMKQSLILPNENLTNTFEKNLTTSGVLSLNGSKVINFFIKVYKSTNTTANIKLGYNNIDLNMISITRLA